MCVVVVVEVAFGKSQGFFNSFATNYTGGGGGQQKHRPLMLQVSMEHYSHFQINAEDVGYMGTVTNIIFVRLG